MGVPNLNNFTTATATTKNGQTNSATTNNNNNNNNNASNSANTDLNQNYTPEGNSGQLSKEEAEARYAEALEEQFARQEGGA